MTNLTLPDQYFHRFPCQKSDICNCAEFSSTEQLQISFFEIILRHPVATSLIENNIFCRFQYSEVLFCTESEKHGEPRNRVPEEGFQK